MNLHCSQRPHFFRRASSLTLTCRKPRNEHAALKLFGALCLRWAEPTQTTAPVSSASQTLSIFQFSSCEKWEGWRNSVMDRTGRRLKINSRRFGWVRAPSLFILVWVSMGAQWWNQKREEKIKQSWTGQCIWLGLPWQQSAWMQINSTLSTRGGMQPFCLRFGEEVNTSLSQQLHHSTTYGIEDGGGGRWGVQGEEIAL